MVCYGGLFLFVTSTKYRFILTLHHAPIKSGVAFGRKGSRRMFGPILHEVIQIVAAIWLAVQIGEFIKLHVKWKPDTLFWAFWTCFILLLTVSVHTLDLYYQLMR